jgi:TPR repeat protein
MEFNYPKKLTEFNLNTITQNKNGRGISDKSLFSSLKWKSTIHRKLFGKTNYVTAFYADDYITAYRLALSVAAKDAVAASLVAHMSSNGIGCEINLIQGKHWLKIAAEGGEPIAMARFGMSILNSSPALAFRLMKDSFLDGNEFAGMLLLNAVITVPILHDTPSFQEIKDEILLNAESSERAGFTKAGELLRVYKAAFPS